MDYYTVLPAADLWGLTAGKFDHSGFCRGRSVTFVHMEVRSRAGVRLLSINPPWYTVPVYTGTQGERTRVEGQMSGCAFVVPLGY